MPEAVVRARDHQHLRGERAIEQRERLGLGVRRKRADERRVQIVAGKRQALHELHRLAIEVAQARCDRLAGIRGQARTRVRAGAASLSF